MQVNSYFINSFLFHLINTGAKGFQDLRTLKEEKTDEKAQPGGPSKGNEERETTSGESGHLDRETQTSGNTEPGILSFFCLFVCFFFVILVVCLCFIIIFVPPWCVFFSFRCKIIFL